MKKYAFLKAKFSLNLWRILFVESEQERTISGIVLDASESFFTINKMPLDFNKTYWTVSLYETQEELVRNNMADIL